MKIAFDGTSLYGRKLVSLCALLLLCVAVRQDGVGNERPQLRGHRELGVSSLPRFTRTPVIYQNPNPSVPMAAIVEFATNKPVRARLLLNDGRSERFLAAWKSYKTEHSLPVLGLSPGRKNKITVIVSDIRGNDANWSDLEFTTEPLPAAFPAIQAIVSHPERMEPGVTLFAPIKPGFPSYGLLVAVDERGEVVWYYRSDENMSDVRRLQNGNLLFLDVTGAAEIDMLGNVVQRWHPSGNGNMGRGISTPVNADTFHHELYEMPSKHFLVLGTELRRFANYPTSESDASAPAADSDVVGDVAIEFRRDGTIVNQWHLFDLLDPYRIGFDSLSASAWNRQYPEAVGGTKGWSHSNAVIYDPPDDSVIVSIRHQDALVKIGRQTGKLIWILGSPEGWNSPWNRYLLAPEGELQWPYHQHAPKITPQGTILLFDNGNFRHRPFDQRPDQNYSRAVEFAVDCRRMTVSQIWSYGGPGGEIFFSNALGDADWMPHTGNVLVTDGSRVTAGVPDSRWARIVEVTHTKPPQKVFELVIKDAPGSDSLGWRIYRSERIPRLYPPESTAEDVSLPDVRAAKRRVEK